MRTSDAETGERDIQKRGDDSWAHAKCFIVEFGDGMSVGTDVAVQILRDGELACGCGRKCCRVVDEIRINAQTEIKSGTKTLHSCSSLNSYTKSCLESCRPRRAENG